MSDVAIHVEGLGKEYHLRGQKEKYRTLRDTLANAATTPARVMRRLAGQNGHEAGVESFWALKDVSFEVKRGEVVGVIGRNGAGKSTLLKILSRITEPTEGYADIYGRVGSLLEVGTGFHPELSGRENIFLNGAILGMRRAEIERQFDAIVAFAEVEKFIDTPVKHYSSGMYLRLAFAVAAHLEPEILIVDEVLAVGDAAFQKKCMGKMQDVAGQGRTVLFVSHNMGAIESLCQQVLWLDKGRVSAYGNAEEIVRCYLRGANSTVTEQSWESFDQAPGNEYVRLHRVCVRPVRGEYSGLITIRTPFVIEFEYWNRQEGAMLGLSFEMTNEQGITVCNPATYNEPIWHGKPHDCGLFRSSCFFPGDLLNNGTHNINLVITKNDCIVLHKQREVLRFDVLDSTEMRGHWHGKWPGAVRPNLEWKTELVSDIGNDSFSIHGTRRQKIEGVS